MRAQNQFTLAELVEMARNQSPFSKQAETRKENRYWSYRFYKSNYNPQIRLSGNVPGYRKRVDKNQDGAGIYRYNYIEVSDNYLNLGLIQPLYFSGGDISVNSELFYNHNFLSQELQTEPWTATFFNIRLNQPLFAFNKLKWDRRTEPLRYEESKRSYAEELESISSETANRFFNVLDAQINLQIATFNLANNDTIYKIENGRYNIGTTTRDKLLQAELQLLTSRQQVTQAKIDLQTAKLQLRSYLGLRDAEEYQLSPPEELPKLVMSVEQAVQLAKENRADFIAFERRKLEADREVAQAMGQRFTTNLSATFGLNNKAFDYDQLYSDHTPQQSVNLQLDVPIVGWGRNKAMIKTAQANKRLNDYVIAQDEVNFEQQIITQVSQFEVLISQIEITKKSDEIAQERYIVSQNRYLIGKIDITNLNIALTEKDTAKRNYVSALRAFWTAYYDLRRMTLYDFANNKLLYNPELN